MNMFWCEKTMDAIPVNVYREYILQRLRQLSYPVIVKGIFGTGGKMITCDSFEALNDFLMNSNPDSQDYYVEEKAEGEELGVEIYGRDGSYEIGPFLYLNTEKKGYDYFRQNLKFGPVTDEKYGLDGLLLCQSGKAVRRHGDRPDLQGRPLLSDRSQPEVVGAFQALLCLCGDGSYECLC